MKIVIVGAGEVGFHTAHQLSLENKDVVVIDSDPKAIRNVSENIDVQTITGSGSSPVVLHEAGIRNADILLAVTDRDEANLASCLVANIIAPDIKKFARLRDGDFDSFCQRFHDNAPFIDKIINPEIEVIRTIEKLMKVPGAVDVGEFSDGRIQFIGINIDEDSPVAGIRLSDISVRTKKHSPLIAAIIRNEKLIIPNGRDRILPKDVVYFISEETRLLETLKVFNQETEPIRRALIVGAGRIGLRLARLLEKKGISTKIVEKDPVRCAAIADELNKTIVLQGDGTDQRLLDEENIQDIDMVISLTGDDQTNILASLLAKSLGAKKTITKLTKFSYFPLMTAIGIDQVVSPRLSAINTILQHIRRGKVLSAIMIKGEQAEAIEAVAIESSGIVGKPLKHIHFPKRALITGIIRNDRIIIPSGESIIEPNDRVIIFAEKQAIPDIENKLTIKLERI
ncbi:MAG: Trk system potassium transporter TrkA [Desulfobacterales bacterium]|nr:Trk system potassium transporter TrkA [Desulfobacterales bacterium]MDD4393803.1 Trk system potassium transporter TrkA [Desulfobacterales bacterium]